MMDKQVTEMTLQELVDYAVQQMVAQGGPAQDEKGVCQYVVETEEGQCKHCAIGWILAGYDIDASDYYGAIGTLAHSELVIPDIIKDNLPVFQSLQLLHDTCSHVKAKEVIEGLERYGIDTSGEWFSQWFKMRWLEQQEEDNG